MANPSLQIGNGKFAIKENDLLGYSSSGTRFFPIPITMTRATLGSRVNPSGLIEDVALLGSELVSCGDFACADPDAVWNRGTGWTISGGSANCDGSQSSQSNLYQTGIVPINISYKVTFTTTVSAGGVTLAIGGSNAQTITTESGTYTFTSKATSGDSNFYFSANSDFIGSISNVSVKEATIDGLARVDYTDGTGSLLVEPQRTNLITYSEDFTSWYQIQNTNLTPNSTTSPSGDGDGTKFLSTSTGAKVRENFSAVSGTTYTFSVYCKNIDATLIKLLGYDGANEFNANLTSEVNTSTWTRISLTFTAANTGSGQIQIARDLPDTESAYFWGAQLEEGSYPTSYIKTQGSTVTRNQDEYTKTGISDKINSEEGVLFVEMAALSNDGTQRAISIYKDTSLDNLITIQYNSVSNNIRYLYRQGVVSISDLNFAVNDIKTNHKIAATWKQNEFKLFVDGIKVGENLIGNIAPQNTFVGLYFRRPDGNNLFGKVKQLQIFKTALSDSELATLTTI